MCTSVYMYRANFLILSLNACKNGSVAGEIWNTLSITVVECVDEYTGYIAD